MMVSSNDLHELARFQLFLRRLKKIGMAGLMRSKRWRTYMGIT